MYLSKLENEKKILIYLKLGRFGKSLFTSMMYYYYDVDADIMIKLFLSFTEVSVVVSLVIAED